MATNGTANGSSHSDTSTVPLQINGKEVHTSKTYDVQNPGTGKLLWRSSAATKKEAIAAVGAAQAAFPSWSKTKPAFRRDIFLKASDILAKRGDEFAKYMDEETGSVSTFSKDFGIPTSVEQLRDIAGRIATVTGSVAIPGEEGKSALLLKEPFGVVFGIAPWNVSHLFRAFRSLFYLFQERSDMSYK